MHPWLYTFYAYMIGGLITALISLRSFRRQEAEGTFDCELSPEFLACVGGLVWPVALPVLFRFVRRLMHIKWCHLRFYLDYLLVKVRLRHEDTLKTSFIRFMSDMEGGGVEAVLSATRKMAEIEAKCSEETK